MLLYDRESNPIEECQNMVSQSHIEEWISSFDARLTRMEQAEARFDAVYSRLDNIVTVSQLNEMRSSLENRLNTLTTICVGVLVAIVMLVVGAVASGLLGS